MWLILTGLILCSSCGGEEKALKTETLYFNEFNAGWITRDTIDDTFVMVDNNGISQSFSMVSNTYYLNKSWSTFMGINTKMTLTEYHYQFYISSFGTNCSISLTAGLPPYGDDIFVYLDGTGFAYDFDFEIVSRLETPFGYKSLLMTDEGYKVQEDGEILSRVEILDSLQTTYARYDEVLHFTLNDFNEQWTNLTITEIYIAKGPGLVKYTLAGGIKLERNPGPLWTQGIAH